MTTSTLAKRAVVSLFLTSTLAACAGPPTEQIAPPEPLAVAPGEQVAPPEPLAKAPAPNTGSITGHILTAQGDPLVNVSTGEQGIVALFCPDPELDVECLHEDYSDLDISLLLASICDTYDGAASCLLHWGTSAAKTGPDGSYTLTDVPPGTYDLILMIVSSGVVVTIQLINVDPVQAGEITVHDFATQ
jgi:hypothetical protein